MVLTETILTIGAGIFIGVGISNFLMKHTNLSDKIAHREVNKVLNNPQVLKEKLESSGELVDLGEKLDFKIVKNEEGKEVLEVKKTSVKSPIKEKTPILVPSTKKIHFTEKKKKKTKAKK